jgi:hypothetical protein
MKPHSLRPARRWPGAFLLACLCACLGRAAADDPQVVVYGATPGGIAAAIAAAKDGRSVLLAEPTHRIGGMTTCGLSHTDFRTFESLSGIFLDFTRRTHAHYVATYGADSVQVRESFRGTQAEPKVNLQVFQEMLSEYPSIRVRTQWTLSEARTRGPSGNVHVRAARFRDATGALHEVKAKIFIDASYEGDLIAAAHIPYRIGGESRDEFNESLAPVEGSRVELQAYNFRLVVTQDPANRVTPTPPAGYRREIFTGLLGLIEYGRLKRVFSFNHASDAALLASTPGLPNGKRDANDMGSAPVRMSLPGENLLWPEGDAVVRKRIFDEHLLWNVGVIYFLQNDPAVPAAIREEARTWGFCRDEFTETNHLPPQLYVREARRMVGLRIFTQLDTRHAANDARAVLHPDSIAMGDYGHNSHGNRHEGGRFAGTRHGTGYGSSFPVPAYQVPYGTIVPRDVRNLLAPVPVSATHVGFCALRYEPIWSSLGEAAGHAAHIALGQGAAPDVRSIDVARLQRRLHAAGSATLYFSDVLPGHPDFAAAQWWGALGGFHDLAPRPPGKDFRDLFGPQIRGQYYQACRNHEAALERVLDAELARKWKALARENGLATVDLPAADGRTTRGDWLRAAFPAR